MRYRYINIGSNTNIILLGVGLSWEEIKKLFKKNIIYAGRTLLLVYYFYLCVYI